MSLFGPYLGTIKLEEVKSEYVKQEYSNCLNIPKILDELFYRLECLEAKLKETPNGTKKVSFIFNCILLKFSMVCRHRQ